MTTRPSVGARLIGALVAPDASVAEWTLGLGSALLGAVLATLHASSSGLSGWRLVVAAAFAFDIVGGAVITCTPSGKRKWDPPGRTAKAAFGFVASHLAHLAVVAAAFRGIDGAWFGATAAVLLGGAGVILAAPASLRRPLGATALAAAVLVDGFLGPTRGVEWFATVFFFKLLVAYVVPDAARAETPARARLDAPSAERT